MSKNTRISEEGLASGESVQIRSADADAVNPHESLAFVGRLRRSKLFLEVSRLFEYDLSHQSDGSNCNVRWGVSAAWFLDRDRPFHCGMF